jgi:hypothetical protein
MWRFDMTKNVTMAFEEDVLARLRVHAAQNKTTVNAIFRKYAEELLNIDNKRSEVRERLLQLSRQSAAFDLANPTLISGKTHNLTREKTYVGRRFEWPREN